MVLIQQNLKIKQYYMKVKSNYYYIIIILGKQSILLRIGEFFFEYNRDPNVSFQ